MKKTISHLMQSLIGLLLLPIVYAEEVNGLPAPEEIDHIWIKENPQRQNIFYTEESLLKALPNLRKANLSSSLGFGKVWSWQQGKFVLKNGKAIYWRTFTEHLIQIDTDSGPVFYTDVIATGRKIIDNKLISTFYTPDGVHEIVISLEPEKKNP